MLLKQNTIMPKTYFTSTCIFKKRIENVFYNVEFENQCTIMKICFVFDHSSKKFNIVIIL